MSANVSRLMVLVPRVPQSLDERVPWHFLQEIEPLARSGFDVMVASSVEPNYQMDGVKFVKLSLGPLKEDLLEIGALIRFASKVVTALPPGVRKVSQRMLRLVRWNLAVSRAVQSWRPDILHSHWAFPAGSGGYLAAKACGIPLIMTLRGIEHQVLPEFNFGECLDPVYELTLRAALRSCSAVTVCCRDSIARMDELGASDQRKWHLVYHAVDPERLRYRAETATKINGQLCLFDRRVIGCVAGMHDRRKGHRVLLDALARLSSAYREVMVVMVGDGPERPALESYAREIGVADRVVFAGSLHPQEVGTFMRLCDCTVLPTYSEVFGNVVFESLLVGTPAIATRMGTPGDVLAEHGFGALFAAGDASDLARQIELVLGNHQFFVAKAAEGGAFVSREMSIERRIDSFGKLYRQLLSGGHAT